MPTNSVRFVRLAVLLSLITVCASMVAVGAVAAEPTITFDDPGELEENGSADLIATDIPDDGTGVGAYEIELSYNPDNVSLELSETDRFTIETDTEQNARTTVTVVGYTGLTNSTPGAVELATIDVDAETTGQTELHIEHVETFTDTDGNAIAHDTIDLTLNFVDDDDSDEDEEVVGGGGPVGGIDDSEETPDDEEVPDDTEEPIDDSEETPDDEESPDDSEVTPDDEETPDDGDDDTSVQVPGFGVSVALVALFVSGLLVRRSR